MGYHVDVFNGGTIVRSGQEFWGMVGGTGFLLHVERIF